MLRHLRVSRLFALVLAVALAACSEAGPLDPADALDLPEGQPLASVLPDLAPDAKTAGTDKYVPTLERVLRHAVRVVKEKRGDEAAQKVVDQAKALHAEVRAAKEAGDAAAAKAAFRKLEAFSAQVGLRVFGPRLARHVAGDAARKLQAVNEALRAAHEAGQDVGRYVQASRLAGRHLEAAREAWEAERYVVALVHAASALDLAHKVGAALK